MSFSDKTYEEKTFYGASTLNKLFLNGKQCDSTKDLKHFGLGLKQGEIDIFIDANKGIVRSCVVGQLHKNKEVYIDGLVNVQSGKGWVPYIYLGIAQQEIRICKIENANYYGKRLDIVWK